MFILLQIIIFIFSYFVYRIHLWLLYIAPGRTDSALEIAWGIDENKIELNQSLATIYKCYDEIQWLPYALEVSLIIAK